MNTITTFEASDNDDPQLLSPILDLVVAFSEVWEQDPAVSYSTMLKRFTNATMAEGVMDNLVLYCAFTQSNSSVCTELDGIPTYTTSPIVYSKDKYWNTAATIPSQVSVLLMSGKLDPLAPYKYAASLLDALNVTNKELITFDFAASHGAFWSTPMSDGTTCGMKILTSYVTTGGDLASLDRSCVDQVNTLDMSPSTSLASALLNTGDAYNGKSISGFNYDDASDSSVNVWTIVGMSLAAIVVGVLMSWCYRRRRRIIIPGDWRIVCVPRN